MQLGFENKKQMTWAAVLGVIAVLVVAYEVIPFFSGTATPASSAQAAAPAPVPTHPAPAHGTTKPGKKPKTVSLDPTLRLDLLATAEKTQYEGNGRNIFVSQAEEVVIQRPIAPGNTDAQQPTIYTPPRVDQPPPIPLKFYGFASSPGEPKKIFLKNGDDVFVAGEGEIVDRRYKVIRISTTSVEIQDMVYSGPPQNIPLTQG
ncbi:MAG TPA: hypothetical protein VE377_18225 [Candidatus Dormibacteraeota bacterium]|nr:hypothetical protein [Candidatus Dormibacteraeota bacterium]